MLGRRTSPARRSVVREKSYLPTGRNVRGVRGGCLRSCEASLSRAMAPFLRLCPSHTGKSHRKVFGAPSLSNRLRSLDRRRPSLESLLRRPDSFSPSRFCLALAPPCVVGWWGTDERGRTTVLPRIAEVVASFDVSRARRHSSHPLDTSGYPIGA